MANQYGAPVEASQVGQIFVEQYYEMFQHQREYVHRFYAESSSMVRVDGGRCDSASDLTEIHQLIISLNLSRFEIETINSLESWNRGVLVVVSGSGETRDFGGWRKFVQTFFLAPQEKGYFVLNDMFHFADNKSVDRSSVPVVQEQKVDYQLANDNHLPDPPVSDHTLEEAEDYVRSIHIEGDEPVPEYRYQDQVPEPEANGVDEEASNEESSVLPQSTENVVQEPRSFTEEPAREPEKLTYASILQAKGKSTPSVRLTQKTAPSADRNHVSQPSEQQPSPIVPKSSSHTVEEVRSVEESESHSVYVKNLPFTLTSLDILEVFKNFGKIKHDGVFLKNRKDVGVCFAFVEFEDVHGAQNAIQASPFQLLGRQVYIEERRSNNGVASRGGRRGGRCRGGRGRGFGRGIEQNGIDNRIGSSGLLDDTTVIY